MLFLHGRKFVKPFDFWPFCFTLAVCGLVCSVIVEFFFAWYDISLLFFFWKFSGKWWNFEKYVYFFFGSIFAFDQLFNGNQTYYLKWVLKKYFRNSTTALCFNVLTHYEWTLIIIVIIGIKTWSQESEIVFHASNILAYNNITLYSKCHIFANQFFFFFFL